MSKFFWCSIFRLSEAAFADEDDNVQLIQTRILQKGPVIDLTTSAGQTECLNTESAGWVGYDCDGTGGNTAANTPSNCMVNYSVHKPALATCCVGGSCGGWVAGQGPDLETSAGQEECFNTLTRTVSYNGWDCDGLGVRHAATPYYCKIPGSFATVCCAKSCGISRGWTSAGAVTTTIPATTTPPTTTTPPPPGGCSDVQPKCLGVTCMDGQWVCGGTQEPDVSVCPGTNSPGGDTDVTDADCLDAERGFGPDFSCANTEMYCSSDSGDGLTVGACCPTKCKQEFEKKKKNSNAEKKGKNEAERKAKRASNEGTRKKNEKERKTKRKDTEWNTKRDAKEIENKNAEEERKNKRGWKEGQRKSERGWKNSRRERRAAANKREAARKAKNGGSESSKKNQQGEKKQKKMAARKAKKEKRIKKNGRKGRKGPQARR